MVLPTLLILIHSADKSTSPLTVWHRLPEQIDFIESMTEAASAVSDYVKAQGKRIVHISVMNAISTSCDCDKTSDHPNHEGVKALQKRIDDQLGREILPYAESLGLGDCKYNLVKI